MTQMLLCKTASLSPTGDYKFKNVLLVCSFFTSSIFFEQPGRIEEIMLWVLPRFMEQTWNFLKKLELIPGDIPYFTNFIFGISIGVLVHKYINEKDAMKSKYKTIASLLVDNHISTNDEEIKKEEFDVGAFTYADTRSYNTFTTINTLP